MKKKPAVIMPLATALAALATGASADVPNPSAANIATTPSDSQLANQNRIEPNTVFRAGEDLLGLLVTKNADGTIVAQHASHYSHSSHASHVSHASSRY